MKHIGGLNKAQAWRGTLWMLFAGILVYLCLGVGLGTWQRPEHLNDLIWSLRWPRVITALMVGMALALAGAALQALFANPLADSSLIGTSSGAALGVVLLLAVGAPAVGISLAAFLGAMSVCALVLVLQHYLRSGRLGLLIVGFAISAFCGSAVSLILVLSNNAVLRSATNWLAGNLSSASFIPLSYGFVTIMLGTLLLLVLSRRLDILLLGDETAASMGVDVTRSRVLIVVATALLTSASVALTGMIGFIGMMIPNVIAHVYGGTRRSIMLRSALLGGIFLLIMDTLARHVLYPIELPVGILIALMGAPFFLWLFVKGMRS